MTVGEQIRRARRARGWTQARLARLAKVSQPYVSVVERGRVGTTPEVRKLLKALGLDEEPGERPRADAGVAVIEAALAWTAPMPNLALPLAILSHRNPSASGDFFAFLPMPQREVLIVALDVAGNGRTAAPGAIYLQGWLRGWVSTLASSLRLESLARDLQTELDAARVEASFFLARLGPHPTVRHAVQYAGLSHGYPTPILLTGGGIRTAPSAGNLSRDGRGEPQRHELLAAPWTLIVASDGLLRRLGAGSEQDGKAALLRWQTGTRRGVRPERYLASDSNPAEDESLALVSWQDWDRNQDFNIADDQERHRVASIVEADAARAAGPRGAAAIRAALAEALDNAYTHAYQSGGGTVTVRCRAEPGRFRVEVEDGGTGGAIKPADGIDLIEKWGCELDHYARIPTGTCVSVSVDANTEG